MIEDRPVDPRRIEQLTGGNPFFVGEMLAHAGDDLPTSVRDAILSRTTELDADAWDLLAPPRLRAGGDPRSSARRASASASCRCAPSTAPG